MQWVLVLICFVGTLGANPWGKDAELCQPRQRGCATPKQQGPLIRFSEIMIGFHQNVISPADGPRSHFKPSSSRYTMDAIHKYGFVTGFLLGCDRLMRENNDPWVYPTIVTEDGLITKWDPVQ